MHYVTLTGSQLRTISANWILPLSFDAFCDGMNAKLSTSFTHFNPHLTIKNSMRWCPLYNLKDNKLVKVENYNKYDDNSHITIITIMTMAPPIPPVMQENIMNYRITCDYGRLL